MLGTSAMRNITDELPAHWLSSTIWHTRKISEKDRNTDDCLMEPAGTARANISRTT
jgi:hypothetical protein